MAIDTASLETRRTWATTEPVSGMVSAGATRFTGGATAVYGWNPSTGERSRSFDVPGLGVPGLGEMGSIVYLGRQHASSLSIDLTKYQCAC